MRSPIVSNRPTKALLIGIAAIAGCGGSVTASPSTSGASGTMGATGTASGGSGSTTTPGGSGSPTSSGTSGTSGASTSPGSGSTGATGDIGVNPPTNLVDASAPDSGDSGDQGSCADPAAPFCSESFTVGPGGGTITAGRVSLTIPPGALPSDTVITLTIDPWSTPAGWIGCSPLYQFGPADLTFALPATIQISGVSQQPLYPQASLPVLVLDSPSGTWSHLLTTATATTISAQITELGSAACVAFVDAGTSEPGPAIAPGVPAANCQAVAPCGGDPTGSWTLTNECFTLPYEADSGCPGATVSVGQTVGNEIISLGSGTYVTTASSGTKTGEHALTVPMSCFEGHEDAGADCFNGPYNLYTGLYPSPFTFNSIPSGSFCGFEGPATFSDEASTSGTYTLSGSTIVTTPDGDGATAGGLSDYCVQGNTLFLFGGSLFGGSPLQSPPSDATSTVVVLTRGLQ